MGLQPRTKNCIYCKKKFDRDKFPFVQVSQRRYAHQECSLTEDQKKDKEEQAAEEYGKEKRTG